jgi:2-polyprenyl-6-methoxyphenol hydroxylase-like FAD-dependent oxidoreductase
MKILIIGGGVAGCAMAGFANKYHLGQVTLVERTNQLGNMGYLVGLWGNGRKILRELGIEHAIIAKSGAEITSTRFEDRQGRLIKAVSFAGFREFGGNVAVTRADLQQALLTTINKGIEIKLTTTVTKLEQTPDAVAVELSDATQGQFDLVVAADGINSSTRDRVFGPGFKKYYGSAVWAYWLPETLKFARQFSQVRGNGKSYNLAHVGNQAMVWFQADVIPGTLTSAEQRKHKLYELFGDFNEQARELLRVMPAAANIFYDDLAYIDMPLWHKARVALMGDAQHAMSPVLGMGVSLALEDAYVLARELRDSPDIPSALQKYAIQRQNRLEKMQKIQRRLGSLSTTGVLKEKLGTILISLAPASFFLSPLRKFVAEKI